MKVSTLKQAPLSGVLCSTGLAHTSKDMDIPLTVPPLTASLKVAWYIDLRPSSMAVSTDMSLHPQAQSSCWSNKQHTE